MVLNLKDQEVSQFAALLKPNLQKINIIILSLVETRRIFSFRNSEELFITICENN